MKTTGIARGIDSLGRIVIPKEIRDSLRIREGDKLEIYTNKDMICLKKLSFQGDYAELIKRSLDELSENWSNINNAQKVSDKLHEALELLREKN